MGAGFSKPAGFPLATELTAEVLDALRKIVGDDYELFEFVEGARQVHRWIERSSSMPAINIEEFYEYATIWAEQLRLEHHREPVGRNAGETTYALAGDLITLLSYLDEHLLDVLLEHESKAQLDAVERFVAALGPHDSLITFNYDRLVERCLTNQGKPWSFGLDGSSPGIIPVLKMHGSVDWICFARDQQPSQHGARLLFSKRDVNRERDDGATARSGEDEFDYELFQIDDDDRLRGLIEQRDLIRFDYRWGLAGLGPRKRPSLVPGLGVVWEHARQALFDADQIVVVGFSFSGHDRLAQIEFARVMAGRDAKEHPPPQVIVIDPVLRLASGQIPPVGNALIERIETVFRPAIPIGAFHETFDWNSLV